MHNCGQKGEYYSRCNDLDTSFNPQAGNLKATIDTQDSGFRVAEKLATGGEARAQVVFLRGYTFKNIDLLLLSFRAVLSTEIAQACIYDILDTGTEYVSLASII